MKSRKLSRLLFSACFSLLAVSAPARQLPGADPFRGLYKNWKGRMTPQQEQRRRHRQLVEDVVKACPRSSAADIRKFMSLFESESAISGFFGGASAKPCTEPWAEAVRSVRLVASGKFRDGITAMRALAERLPPGDILRTHLFMMELAAQKAGTPAHREIERKLIADIEAAVLSGKYRGSSIYLFYYNTLAQSDDCGSRYWGEFAQRLNPVADRVDPWFLAMIRGRAAVFWAWESRGGGYADSVTREGWKGFHGNLDEARKHLYRAAKLFPERVSPYIRLITVEMGCGNQAAMIAAFRKLVWYDAANEAGWRAVLWGLQPRWGGSHELMKKLAVEALECPRRDAGVAEAGYQALSEIAWYYSSYRWQNVYLDPEVRRAADRLFAEYAKKLRHREYLWYDFCRKMALLEYDAAAEALREYGVSRAAKERRRQWGMDFNSKIGTPGYDDLLMRLKVFTGEHSARLRAAERLYLSGKDGREAFRELEAVIREGGLPPEERNFLVELYGRWKLDRAPEVFCGENGQYLSAAIVAERIGRPEVAEELRRLGCRTEEKFPGETIYNIALESDDAGAVRRCHAAGAKLDGLDPEYGYAPIHVAAMYGRPRIVEALLELGVPVESRDREGHTVLQIAATKKQARVISVLFARGADPNAQDGDGDFCLIYLPQVRAPESIYRMFLKHPKTDVKLRNHSGEGVLHYLAAFDVDPAIFKLLIDAGADRNLRDNRGRTPLDVAEEKGNRVAAEFLRSVGAERGAAQTSTDTAPPRRNAAPPAPSPAPPKYWYWGGGALILLLVLSLVLKRRN